MGRQASNKQYFDDLLALRLAIVALWATCLAHLSRLLTKRAYKMDASRRLSVRPSTLSNMNISKTSGPIDIGKSALGLGPDRIGILVALATDSSLLYSCNHKILDGFEIRTNSTDCGVSCP